LEAACIKYRYYTNGNGAAATIARSGTLKNVYAIHNSAGFIFRGHRMQLPHGTGGRDLGRCADDIERNKEDHYCLNHFNFYDAPKTTKRIPRFRLYGFYKAAASNE